MLAAALGSGLYKKLYSEGKIKLRIYKAVHGPGPNAEGSSMAVPSLVLSIIASLFARSKLVADGALGSRELLYLEPCGSPATSGFLTVKLKTGSLLPWL